MVLHSIHLQKPIHCAISLLMPNANNQENCVEMKSGNGKLDAFSTLKFVLYDIYVLGKVWEQI
jgi:hypothetical protein